jgi:hypothetical protein
MFDHLFGTKWVSFTENGERIRTGEADTIAANTAERTIEVSIFAVEAG